MDSSSGQDSTGASHNSVSSVRGKSDIAWNHVSLRVANDGSKTLSCSYCGLITKGGGIHRMKQHLAGKKGDIRPCNSVPPDVRYQMEESLKGVVEKKRQVQEKFDIENPYGSYASQSEGAMPPEFVDLDQTEDAHNCPVSAGKRLRSGAIPNQNLKGKGVAPVPNFFAPRTTPGSQPTLKSVLASKEAIHRAHMAIAKFFYDTCIPINAANSIHFQAMFDAAVAIGPGFKVPSYYDLRIPLLREAKKEVQLFVDTLQNIWEESGCTIMGDGWSDGRNRSIINFLIYCPRGTVFLKSVDASDAVKDAQMLFSLFREVIEWVGVKNIVHMVTDNGSNYVAAGRLISDEYPSITWSPCAAHCLNLLMKDIAERGDVMELAKKASKISKFVYNHTLWLSWLRKRPDWTEIVRPGQTRFATTFLTLQNICLHMHDLKALVTCKQFIDSKLYREKKTKEVVGIILDRQFWNDCNVIVKIVEPVMRLLRIVDGDKKPSVGYVYEGMLRVRKGIKAVFRNRKELYGQYTKLINHRWDKHLKKSIHAAAYWLNHAFQYDQSPCCQKPEIMNGVYDMIETKGIGKKTKYIDEIRLFRDRLESFGRELAINSCKTTQPDEWWRLFGHSAPNLQKLAIRILGQTSSSSGCERNWSVFEWIHTKKRNRLEHQRLNDLVYVHYNMKLKQRIATKEKDYDPIDYESIDKTDFWVVEEEEEPFLSREELEKALYEELENPKFNRQSSRPSEVYEEEQQSFGTSEEDLDLNSFENMIGCSANLHDVDVAIGVGTSVGSERSNCDQGNSNEDGQGNEGWFL